MTRIVPLRLQGVIAAVAVAAALPLASCNAPAGAYDDEVPYALPDLPATLPLALGEPTPPVYAPAAAQIPYAAPIPAGYIADPDDHYAYAEDAWGFSDALGYAPPDYGFYYDDVEPWAWQAYDDSMMFVEPLDYGYRYYYYRAGDDYPYFVRDPDCGYGYDDGRLAVIYGSDGRVIHYSAYDTYLPYASAYYYRGHGLWRASRERHPVIVGNWEHRRHGIYNSYHHWSQERARHRDWLGYHRRIADRQDRYWERERARRLADRVRYATWREQDFRTPPPPRAIPARWTRAEWARDERRFAPPVRGFEGDREDRQRAARQERLRLAALNRQPAAERRERVRDLAEQRRDRRIELAQLRNERRDLRGERIDRRAELRSAALRSQQRADRRDDARRTAEARREQQLVERNRIRAQRQQAEVRSERRQERAERQRGQAEDRRQAQAARAEARERQQRQAAERTEARQRSETQARQRQEVEERRAARARDREQARERGREQAQARQEAQERRQQAEQRREQQVQARSEARERQQAQREQVQARAQQRAEARERRQERTEVRSQPRQERPARTAQAREERSAQTAQARADRQEARRARREARQE